MFNRLVKTARPFLLAVALLVVPFAVDTSDTQGLSVRPATACAQATDCAFAWFRICSTYHGDHWFYKCVQGCDDEGDEEEN